MYLLFVAEIRPMVRPESPLPPFDPAWQGARAIIRFMGVFPSERGIPSLSPAVASTLRTNSNRSRTEKCINTSNGLSDFSEWYLRARFSPSLCWVDRCWEGMNGCSYRRFIEINVCNALVSAYTCPFPCRNGRHTGRVGLQRSANNPYKLMWNKSALALGFWWHEGGSDDPAASTGCVGWFER